MRISISFPKSIDILDVEKENTIDICMNEAFRSKGGLSFITSTYEKENYVVIYEVVDFMSQNELKSLEHSLARAIYDPSLKVITGEI